jgi:hypothetical protein
MIRSIRRKLLVGCLIGLIAAPPGVVSAGPPFWKSKKVATCTERLATEIDALECYLNDQGTVVAKSPDIWGEARLTTHRQEFDKKLAEKLGKFEPTFNASFRASDQAFLSAALAIANATGANGSPDLTLVNTMAVGGELASADNGKLPITRTGPAVSTAFTDPKVQLEPVIELDQLKRYLDHLQEIRRINEGDDVVDTPGYSLNLVRIPISVLPGDATRKGYGAEVTVTATPHITPELLPTVFRQLVVNDLIDQWHVAVSQMAVAIAKVSNEEPESKDGPVPQSAVVPRIDKKNYEQLDSTSELKAAVDQAQQSLVVSLSAAARRSRLPVPGSQFVETFGRGLRSIAFDFYRRSGVDSVGCANGSKPGQHLYTQLGPLEARSYLRDEIEAAYDYLMQPNGTCHWQNVRLIAQFVRENDLESLEKLRRQVVVRRPYTSNLEADCEACWTNNGKPCAGTTDAQGLARRHGERETPTSVLAWAILVHAALLNEQLNQDMKRVSQDPNCACVGGDCVHEFYLPDPLPDARQAFIEYVKCRWPVHVFALDPVSQDQNVIDTFSLRREMQLAFALSLAAGKTSPNSPAVQNMERYARRLELDIETISLNRTAIAFAHGEDTFGWRFYPRVQTPGFDSNAKVLVRDLLIGGPSKDALRGQWDLEPGPRECTAIVVMPSFIDHMRFDVRGNYFKLCSPEKQKATVLSDVKWSQRIRNMRGLTEAVIHEQELYRDGEVDRLLKRVDQLEKRLPLQTVHARVPNENTFGGFEMFASGTSDLAPELYGFYGEPGVAPGEETELFLHGENFSIHGTQVIAGNTSCTVELLSRQVMKVKIPKDVRAIRSAGRSAYVDLHLATPYGVTSHLEIPVAEPCTPADVPPPVTGYRFQKDKLSVRFGYYEENQKIAFSQTSIRAPHQLTVKAPENARVPGTATVTVTVRGPGGGGPQPIVATMQLENVAYNRESHGYTIEHANYVKLFKEIRDGLLANKVIPADFIKADNGVLQLTVGATIGTLADPVENELSLEVTFSPVPPSEVPTARVASGKDTQVAAKKPMPVPPPSAPVESPPPGDGVDVPAPKAALRDSSQNVRAPNPPPSRPKALASRRSRGRRPLS